MADLVSGRWPQTNPWWSLLGQPTNVNQSDVPARSNLEWLGMNTAIATGTGASSGVANCVAVPVDQGVVISKVSIFVTATAAGTPTHSFAALYNGSGAAPALIGQSTDGGTAAVAANAQFSFTPPYGFVYVAFSLTATTMPSFVTVAGPTIGAWGTMVPPTNAPLFYSATAGSSLGGTAATTIASPSNVTNVPVVVLT